MRCLKWIAAACAVEMLALAGPSHAQDAANLPHQARAPLMGTLHPHRSPRRMKIQRVGSCQFYDAYFLSSWELEVGSCLQLRSSAACSR